MRKLKNYLLRWTSMPNPNVTSYEHFTKEDRGHITVIPNTLYRHMSQTQVLLTKISQTCQSIRDIKKGRKQLAFHKTSNTSKGITSCSSPQGHITPHSSTGDEDGRDDNAKKSNSSTSSSVGGRHTPGIPTHRDPKSPAPDPTPTSRSPSPERDPRSPPPDDEGGSSPAS